MKREVTRFCFYLIICISTLSCQKSAEESYNSALVYAENNDWVSALKELDRSIEVKPNYGKAFLERGRIKHKIYTVYSSLGSSANDDKHSDPLLGEIVSDSVFKGPINDYNMALKFDSTLAKEVQFGMGNIFFSLKKYRRAIIEYQKVLQVDSTNKELSINLVMCKFFLADTIGAFNFLDQVVEMDPKNAESYYLRAIHKIMANNIKKKESGCLDLRKSLDLYDPSTRYLHDNLKQSIEELIEINCNDFNSL